jgi:hypothetical protein
MKLLATKANVNAADADYPYGDVRNKAGATPGTLYNKEFMNDMVQFFERMFAVSGLVANGEFDNATNGFQLFESLMTVIPKKYVKQVSSVFDGDVITITRAEIVAAFGDVTPFHAGTMGTSTTAAPKVDFAIQIWWNDSGTWRLMPLLQD